MLQYIVQACIGITQALRVGGTTTRRPPSTSHQIKIYKPWTFSYLTSCFSLCEGIFLAAPLWYRFIRSQSRRFGFARACTGSWKPYYVGFTLVRYIVYSCAKSLITVLPSRLSGCRIGPLASELSHAYLKEEARELGEEAIGRCRVDGDLVQTCFMEPRPLPRNCKLFLDSISVDVIRLTCARMRTTFFCK